MKDEVCGMHCSVSFSWIEKKKFKIVTETEQLFFSPPSSDGQPCPVVSWDASLYPEGRAAGWSTVRLTWGEYQSSLKQRCWHKNISPKPDSGCSTVHHYEWSKLALFDFLLQVTEAI